MSTRAKRILLPALLVLAVMATGEAAAVDGSVRAAPPELANCSPASAPKGHPASRHLRRPPLTVTRRARLVAVVKTNCGSFQIALDARRAPKIVNSFVYLARARFYDGLLFYRVVPHFVIEGGTPHNKGLGGPGYHVTEPPPPHFHYRFGTVAMARTAEAPPGQAGSDFFIVTGQARYIRNEYAILGHVRAGRATVERIDAFGTAGEVPSRPIRIDSILIRRAG